MALPTSTSYVICTRGARTRLSFCCVLSLAILLLNCGEMRVKPLNPKKPQEGECCPAESLPASYYPNPLGDEMLRKNIFPFSADLCDDDRGFSASPREPPKKSMS